MDLHVNPNAFVCIMAGGSGERFWPMSRRRTPKHLLKLFSDRTLVEDTVRRLDGVVPRENIFVLTNEAQLAGTRAALPFLATDQIVAEPAKRDTAPAAALATGLVRARHPEGVLALLPADALINFPPRSPAPRPTPPSSPSPSSRRLPPPGSATSKWARSCPMRRARVCAAA
jgi:mannose-1-phosphate guanylyltransferase